LRAKVELREDPAYTGPYPARFGASVQVDLTDGRSVTREVPDALGDPENPLTDEQLCGKARMLMASAGYSAAAAADVIRAALALVDGGSVAGLTRQLN
jgi:2-methylcitrate dehydratase PrpD